MTSIFFRVERKATERAASKIMEEARSIKRKSDALSMSTLPKIKKH